MTIFHVIKYPVSDYLGENGIKGLKEIRTDLPELYNSWFDNHCAPYYRKRLDTGDFTPIKIIVKELRRMLLEYKE
jgi:hypothetical protein